MHIYQFFLDKQLYRKKISTIKSKLVNAWCHISRMDNNALPHLYPTKMIYLNAILKKKPARGTKKNATNKTTPSRVTLHTHPRLAT
jgi:hypothetical protein